MAVIMSAVIVAGFSVNLVLGRSTFAVPLAYHVHAVVFFGWVALYLAQNRLVATNNIRLHRTLGLLAFPLAPLMVLLGTVIIITALRCLGGPLFSVQNEFIFRHPMPLMLLGAVDIVALSLRRHTRWPRRMMLRPPDHFQGLGH